VKIKKIKNKIIIACSAFILLIGGCQSGSKRDKAQDNVSIDRVEQPAVAENQPLQFQLVKIAGKKDTLTFDIKSRSFVNVTLSTPDETGNIRINQIIMPDGAMDGPFGKTYHDSLHIPGTYQLILAESLMLENPYTGEYQVKIEVEEDQR